jgi:hypothetical protein
LVDCFQDMLGLSDPSRKKRRNVSGLSFSDMSFLIHIFQNIQVILILKEITILFLCTKINKRNRYDGDQ